MNHIVDGYIDEQGRIVRNGVFDPVRKALAQLLHFFHCLFLDIQGIGAGELVNCNRGGRFLVYPGIPVIFFSP